MINLLTLFYSFSGLVPGTGPRSQLHKLGDKDLCCVGVETLNHLQHTYVSHRTRSLLITASARREPNEETLLERSPTEESLDFARIKLFFPC